MGDERGDDADRRRADVYRHNALYSTRAWQRLSARVLRTWRGEHGNWCPGYGATHFSLERPVPSGMDRASNGIEIATALNV